MSMNQQILFIRQINFLFSFTNILRNKTNYEFAAFSIKIILVNLKLSLDNGNQIFIFAQRL